MSLSAAFGCSGPACTNDVISGAPSPDGALIAFVFHRSCGAAGNISTEVSVVGFHASLRNGAGNVLAVDGEQPVKATWRSPAVLLVSGFNHPRSEHAHPLDSVTVEFR